jgi:DNA-binding MarR family transcriptional regulator
MSEGGSAEHWHPMHRDNDPRRVQRHLADRYPGVDPDDIAIEIWIGEIARQIQASLARFLRAADIDESELAVLSALHQADPNRPTAAALARELVITSGGMAKVLSRLERRELIERRPRPEDGRTLSVGLTDSGRAMAQEMADAMMERGADRFADLTSEQRRVVADSLELVARRLRGDPEPVHLEVGAAGTPRTASARSRGRSSRRSADG